MKKLISVMFAFAMTILLAPACGGMGGDPPKDAGNNNDTSGDVVNNDSDMPDDGAQVIITVPDIVADRGLKFELIGDDRGLLIEIGRCRPNPTCVFNIDKRFIEHPTEDQFRLTQIDVRGREVVNQNYKVEGYEHAPSAMLFEKSIQPLSENEVREVTWADDEWGLSPNGEYHYEGEPGNQCSVSTSLKNPERSEFGEWEIQIGSCRFGAFVHGMEFSYDNVEGEISTDLSTITFTKQTNDGPVNLTLIKDEE